MQLVLKVKEKTFDGRRYYARWLVMKHSTYEVFITKDPIQIQNILDMRKSELDGITEDVIVMEV